ncbi:hypothetical protein MXD81_23115, partial [Microbacteriaceae bacterium K1510]|nr:hypothetical protein [Microbacteriaceae bacterium K1510]
RLIMSVLIPAMLIAGCGGGKNTSAPSNGTIAMNAAGESTQTPVAQQTTSEKQPPASPPTPEQPKQPESQQKTEQQDAVPPQPPAELPVPQQGTTQPAASTNQQLVQYKGPVEHIFFHPLIAYPELAFDHDKISK